MEEACANGDLETVKQLLSSFHGENGVDCRMTAAADGLPPGGADVIRRSLCVAANNCQLSTFSFLLDRGAPISGPVVSAVCNSANLDMCDIMIHHGWNVNRLYDGKCPLYIARHNESLVCWLLEHGADPNVTPNTDMDLLAVVCATSTPAVVTLFIQHGAQTRSSRALHAAAGMCGTDPTRLDVIRILLDSGADVNEMEVDPKGLANKRQRTMYTGTPLHHAVECRSVEATRYLLLRGADPNGPSWSGHSALDAAEKGNRPEIADIIRNSSRPPPSPNKDIDYVESY